jgi:hypothetical protein
VVRAGHITAGAAANGTPAPNHRLAQGQSERLQAMPPDTTPNPDDDYLASGPRKNTQFGQQIGVDDTSPPEVAHGGRARESESVDDGHGGVMARFAKPMDHRPPPEEASEASEYGAPEPGPPTADARQSDEGPSVWDASKTEDDGKGR